MRDARLFLLTAPLLALACATARADDWQEIPPAGWKGPVSVEVEPLGRRSAATIALPKKEAAPLEIRSTKPLPAGLYEARLTLRPSHAHEPASFHARLVCTSGGARCGSWAASEFARSHEPEVRVARFVHRSEGPVAISLAAEADEATVAKLFDREMVRRNTPGAGPKPRSLDAGEDDDEFELEFTLRPSDAVYFLVDKAEIRPLSLGGHVSDVTIDKIRYRPGETLRGVATVADAGGKGAKGTVEVSLEHGLEDRVRVASLPVTLAGKPQELRFELALPADELGYAVVAEFVSADGRDRAGAREYFSIAENFQRVAIFGGGLATRDTVLTADDEPRIRKEIAAARADYFNATEYFAWAPDDMVEMSPDADFWSSGQTNYRMNKETIRRQIRLAHEQGLAVATYGKFVMGGFAGWQTAYDRPLDHRTQYEYPVGMWEGVDVPALDRRRDRDFTVYSRMPAVPGRHPFRTWWAGFAPINPDPTPRMARIAAEECVRSIAMFGWDAIRWDGHIRGAGWAQCGRSGQYNARAARLTQSLSRYFKEIVAERFPDFRHGYNYLLIEPDKGRDWAVGDYELDELCRGGGLLMNESIGNASGGWTFDQVAGNLQADGDLCRERGGYYLGISFAADNAPRDVVIESALWAAAGCRPYNASMSREVRRYCTRHGQFTFDERLRRIAAPEKVLSPRGETTLDWKRFVYETPAAGGRSQLVVNLLNLPWQATRPARGGGKEPAYDMPPGTPPVEFALDLPDGVAAKAVHLIEPVSLDVSSLPLANGRFTVPPVSTWAVAVIDLEIAAAATSLADRYGVPKTLGVERPSTDGRAPPAEIVLDPAVEIWEVNKRIGEADAEDVAKAAAERARLDALDDAARSRELLARRPTVDDLEKQWWKAAAIPADLAVAKKRPAFGDLAPRRNGRLDVLYARGAMDYPLRIPEAIAAFDRFSIHHAGLVGAVRQSPGMGLAGGVPPARYPEFDLLLFTGIPHCAIGVEASYALVDYVKAGGAAVFTGGEYAFGKGAYIHTVLERELLPVQMTAVKDTVTAEPRAIEPGPDFEELGVAVDFAAKPSYWVANEVVVKPGAKVFLRSGGRPILVGWQLGSGRVVCLLVDHRGLSEEGVTAFFDWADWPRLLEAAMRWAAPEAATVGKPAAAVAKKADPDAAATAELDALLDDSLAGGTTAEPVVAVRKLESEVRHEQRDAAAAIAAHAAADRVAEGEAAVAAWDTQEATARDGFARAVGPDTALLATSPCLDADAVFGRLCWLGYLARHRPTEFARPFLREWLLIGQYVDQCHRTKHYLISQDKLEGRRATLAAEPWDDLARRFQQAQASLAADAEAAVRIRPEDAATVLCDTPFTPQRHAAINLLGSLDPSASRPILERLSADGHPDIKAVASARLRRTARR